MDVAVAEVLRDVVAAVAISDGGMHTCVECEYENERDLEELVAWHEKMPACLTAGCSSGVATS